MERSIYYEKGKEGIWAFFVDRQLCSILSTFTPLLNPQRKRREKRGR